jgi:dienelactone hydrolase
MIGTAAGAAAESPVVFPAGPVAFARDGVGGTVLFRPGPEAGGGPWSAVVLLPSCTGVTAALYDWAQRLVRAGRLALILDSNTPRGVTNNCRGADSAVSQLMIANDTAAALAWLRSLPAVRPDRLAVVGFSWGAMAAAKMSVVGLQQRTRPPIAGLRAVAAFYPGCGTSEPDAPPRVRESYDWGGDVTTPLMLFLGANDDDSPPGFCTQRAERARASGQPVSYRVYENTTHAFDSPQLGTQGMRVRLGSNRGTAIYRYNPATTEVAAAELLAFLAQHLDGAPAR